MKTEIVALGPYLAFAIAGFMIRFLFDRYAKHKDAVRLEAWRLRVQNLETKLSSFYWPVFCRLKRGSIAWESENFRGKVKSEPGDKFAQAFDRSIIIKNHEETREIIQKNFHHFGGDKEMEASLIQLLHHIDVYLALREAGSQNDPIWVGQPWPNKVEKLVEKKLHDLQREYDDLLLEAGAAV